MSGYIVTGLKDTGQRSNPEVLRSRGRVNSIPDTSKDGAILHMSGMGSKRKERCSLMEGEAVGLNLSYTSVVCDEDESKKATTSRTTKTQYRRSYSLTEGGEKKRKRADGRETETVKTAENPIAFLILKIVEGLKKYCAELEKKVEEKPNMKRDFKELSVKLRRSVDMVPEM